MPYKFKHVVPALPGYFIYKAWLDDGVPSGVVIHRTPIVAWGVVEQVLADEYCHHAVAIALDCERDDTERWPTQLPDGSLYTHQDGSWDNEDQFLEALKSGKFKS